jgi:hypothetical protein
MHPHGSIKTLLCEIHELLSKLILPYVGDDLPHIHFIE